MDVAFVQVVEDHHIASAKALHAISDPPLGASFGEAQDAQGGGDEVVDFASGLVYGGITDHVFLPVSYNNIKNSGCIHDASWPAAVNGTKKDIFNRQAS